MRALRVLAVAAMAAIPGISDAQGIPMLVGTWKGTAYAVSVGSNPYRTPDTKEPNFPSDALEFTFVIREQHDSRFSGTSTAGRLTETLIGAISPDNKGGVILDDDGEYIFTIRETKTRSMRATGIARLHRGWCLATRGKGRTDATRTVQGEVVALWRRLSCGRRADVWKARREKCSDRS